MTADRGPRETPGLQLTAPRPPGATCALTPPDPQQTSAQWLPARNLASRAPASLTNNPCPKVSNVAAVTYAQVNR